MIRLSSENIIAHISENIMMSVNPYWYCRMIMRLTIPEAKTRPIPIKEKLKRFLCRVKTPAGIPTAQATIPRKPKIKNPRRGFGS